MGPIFSVVIDIVSSIFHLYSELTVSAQILFQREQDSLSNMRVSITDEQRRRILRDLVSLNFSFDSNFWGLAAYVLNLNRHSKDLATVVSNAVSAGEARFFILFCLTMSIYIEL